MEILQDYHNSYEAGEIFGEFEAKEGSWSSADQAEQAYSYWFKNQNEIDFSGVSNEDIKSFKQGYIDGFIRK